MEIPAYQRIEHLYQFEKARRRAKFWRFLNYLLNRPQNLLSFTPIITRLRQRTGYHRGVHEIPLRQIVGSINKAHYFDRSFRPLLDRLKNRWVNIYNLQTTGGWDPIVVHKLGNLYFVEDGHHRVSVARQARLKVIEAEIIEYPFKGQFDVNDDLETILNQIDEIQSRQQEDSV